MSSDKAKDYVRIAQSSKPAMVHPRPCVAFRAFKRIFDRLCHNIKLIFRAYQVVTCRDILLSVKHLLR